MQIYILQQDKIIMTKKIKEDIRYRRFVDIRNPKPKTDLYTVIWYYQILFCLLTFDFQKFVVEHCPMWKCGNVALASDIYNNNEIIFYLPLP